MKTRKIYLQPPALGGVVSDKIAFVRDSNPLQVQVASIVNGTPSVFASGYYNDDSDVDGAIRRRLNFFQLDPSTLNRHGHQGVFCSTSGGYCGVDGLWYTKMGVLSDIATEVMDNLIWNHYNGEITLANPEESSPGVVDTRNHQNTLNYINTLISEIGLEGWKPLTQCEAMHYVDRSYFVGGGTNNAFHGPIWDYSAVSPLVVWTGESLQGSSTIAANFNLAKGGYCSQAYMTGSYPVFPIIRFTDEWFTQEMQIPTGITTVENAGDVDLTWIASTNLGVIGYEIYREIPNSVGNTARVLIHTTLGSSTLSWTDDSAESGLDNIYDIQTKTLLGVTDTANTGVNASLVAVT